MIDERASSSANSSTFCQVAFVVRVTVVLVDGGLPDMLVAIVAAVIGSTVSWSNLSTSVVAITAPTRFAIALYDPALIEVIFLLLLLGRRNGAWCFRARSRWRWLLTSDYLLFLVDLPALDELILRLTAFFANDDGLRFTFADDDRLGSALTNDDRLRLVVLGVFAVPLDLIRIILPSRRLRAPVSVTLSLSLEAELADLGVSRRRWRTYGLAITLDMIVTSVVGAVLGISSSRGAAIVVIVLSIHDAVGDISFALGLPLVSTVGVAPVVILTWLFPGAAFRDADVDVVARLAVLVAVGVAVVAVGASQRLRGFLAADDDLLARVVASAKGGFGAGVWHLVSFDGGVCPFLRLLPHTGVAVALAVDNRARHVRRSGMSWCYGGEEGKKEEEDGWALGKKRPQRVPARLWSQGCTPVTVVDAAKQVNVAQRRVCPCLEQGVEFGESFSDQAVKVGWQVGWRWRGLIGKRGEATMTAASARGNVRPDA